METDGLFPAHPPTPVLQMCRDPSLLLAREECSAPRVAGSGPTAWLSNLNHLAEWRGEAAQRLCSSMAVPAVQSPGGLGVEAEGGGWVWEGWAAEERKS